MRLVLPGSIILLLPVFLNGFPLIFQDTSDYLIFTPHLYRSPFYGLFIFFFHLNRFIWGPVIAQAVIVSHLIYLLFKIHLPEKMNCYLPTMLALTLFSTAPIFIGFIMPDILTPVMFICIFLIGFHFEKFSRLTKIYLFLLLCVAISSHLSNLTMACALLLMPFIKHRLILVAPILLTIIAYLSFNILVFNSLALAPAGQSFFLANLIEYGPAKEYLTKACPGYKICPYVDRFPMKAEDFLWERGIFDRLGGFVGMANESNKIVEQTIIHEPGAVIKMIAENFLTALNKHDPTGEFDRSYFPAWTSIYEIIRLKFGDKALSDFRKSAQMQTDIPNTIISQIDAIATPVSFMAVLLLIIISVTKRQKDAVNIGIFMLCGVLGNALLCATVSGVHDRYQARTTWLLLLTAIIMVVSLRPKQQNPC